MWQPDSLRGPEDFQKTDDDGQHDIKPLFHQVFDDWRSSSKNGGDQRSPIIQPTFVSFQPEAGEPGDKDQKEKRAESTENKKVPDLKGVSDFSIKKEQFMQLDDEVKDALEGAGVERVAVVSTKKGKAVLIEFGKEKVIPMDAASGCKSITLDKKFTMQVSKDGDGNLVINNIKGMKTLLDGAPPVEADVKQLVLKKGPDGKAQLEITALVDGKERKETVPVPENQQNIATSSLSVLNNLIDLSATGAFPTQTSDIEDVPDAEKVDFDKAPEVVAAREKDKEFLKSILLVGTLLASSVVAAKLGKRLLRGDGSVPPASTNLTEGKETRPKELIKDAKDYLAKEQLAEPKMMKQYLYEARNVLSGHFDDIAKNTSLNAEQRAAECAKSINEFNQRFFKILQGKNWQNAETLKNLQIQPTKAGEKAGLSFETTDGKPLSLKDGKLVNEAGETVEPGKVRPIFRVPEGLFSNPKFVFEELYCSGFLGTKQALESSTRTGTASKSPADYSVRDSVARDIVRGEFGKSANEAAANEMKLATDSARKAAGENYKDTEREALTQLRRSELVMENGVATFRGTNMDLVSAARDRIKELENQLEKIKRVKEGKETDKELPKDKAELEALEKTISERLAEYKPAYEAALGKDFAKLHTIAGREIPEMMAESELMKQAGEKGGSGRWKAYVFLFAGLLAAIVAARQISAARSEPTTPVYAPVVPKK